jgi:hypothetical protein
MAIFVATNNQPHEKSRNLISDHHLVFVQQ